MTFSNANSIIDAAKGKNGRDQQIIAEEGLAFVQLLLKKNKDYGSSAFKSPVLCGLNPDTAILVRMSDKIERLSNFFSGNKLSVTDESIADTMRDLGAYCLLWLCAQRIQGQVNTAAPVIPEDYFTGTSCYGTKFAITKYDVIRWENTEDIARGPIIMVYTIRKDIPSIALHGELADKFKKWYGVNEILPESTAAAEKPATTGPCSEFTR